MVQVPPKGDETLESLTFRKLVDAFGQLWQARNVGPRNKSLGKQVVLLKEESTLNHKATTGKEQIIKFHV